MEKLIQLRSGLAEPKPGVDDGDVFHLLADYEATGLTPKEVVALRDKRGAGIPIDDTGRCTICGRKMTLEELHAYDSPSLGGYKPRCPICGEKCNHIFRKERYGDILGCDRCVIMADAGEDEAAAPDDYLNDMTMEKLWDDYTSIPTNSETGCIEKPFRDFPAGTHPDEIMQWFTENWGSPLPI